MDPATITTIMSIAPYLMQMLGIGGGSGADKASRQATAEQLRIARQQMDMVQRQSDMDLPMRKYLFDALQARYKQSPPVTRPGQMQYSNPFTSMRASSLQAPQNLSAALRARYAPRPPSPNIQPQFLGIGG